MLTLSDGHLHGGVGQNKRDAFNHIRQFGGRLDRFLNRSVALATAVVTRRNARNPAKTGKSQNQRFQRTGALCLPGALQDLKSKPFATFLTVMVTPSP